MNIMDFPPVYGLFQKRIEGDDSLLRMASQYFNEICLGAQFYAGSKDELNWLLGFNPLNNRPPLIHLDRNLNLLDRQGVDLIIDFAKSFGKRIFGLVIHDHNEMASRRDKYTEILGRINASLNQMEYPPHLYIEYAVGLPVELFISFFKEIKELENIGACIDTGHIGIKQIRIEYARKSNGNDIYNVPASDLTIPEIQEGYDLAVQSALPVVLNVINELTILNIPIHYHLHDGHPLWPHSVYGLSDHISFLGEITIPLEDGKNIIMKPMFGEYGLSQIVKASINKIDTRQGSYTLEIHPAGQRLPLGKYSCLFNHWRDLNNAEQMCHWLNCLGDNHQLLMLEIKNAQEEIQRK